ncbi:hypothetical protein DM813_25875 [Pseudomonas alkylphenolica]|uniref:Uncharacterized protein n=1 Tax=Pseudomonas alkylphenolica TaxID=237609 RepID=A0A443ZHC4_9PSED|nr:hypothetical protein [Pseudomonas alkylphenolica]RWU18094.1 hypothetical protein DM813_25875 [Pseudomonas alkylphenolica]
MIADIEDLELAERLVMIEGLMRHWAEQRARLGLEAGLGSQMGSIMEWKGVAPRGGVSGARILLGGAGLDHSAAEVDAAVAELGRRDKRGAVLSTLAEFRYLHGAPVREQMRVVGLAEDADRTYRNWVKALHLQVLALLIARSGPNRRHTVRRFTMRRECAKGASK